jgi:pimeloyl-ACP methyl ester carboxylesterase
MARSTGWPPVFRRALALAALGTLAACGTTSPGAANVSSSSTSTTTTTTTTTLVAPTTTVPRLPYASSVGGTAPTGSLSALGAIKRVSVLPVPQGSAGPVALPPGPELALDRLRLAFRRFGTGPDLLLIMGQHGTMTWWDPQLLTDLAMQFRVTVFDLPGVGYSQALHAPPTVGSYADATAGLIDALGLDQPVVLGWGLGGQVALSLVERHPSLVSRLVLVDTGVTSRAGTIQSPSASRLFAQPTATTSELSQILFSSTADADRRGWLARIAELPPDDIVATAIAGEARAEAEEAKDGDVAKLLPSVGVTTLVVVGADDAVFPESESTALVAGLPAAKLLVLQGGYASLVDDEARFVTALTDFALH